MVISRLRPGQRIRREDAERAAIVPFALGERLERDAMSRHPLASERGADVRARVQQLRGAPPDAQRKERAPGQIGVDRRHRTESVPFPERGAFPLVRSKTGRGIFGRPLGSI